MPSAAGGRAAVGGGGQMWRNDGQRARYSERRPGSAVESCQEVRVNDGRAKPPASSLHGRRRC